MLELVGVTPSVTDAKEVLGIVAFMILPFTIVPELKVPSIWEFVLVTPLVMVTAEPLGMVALTTEPLTIYPDVRVPFS